MNVQIYKIVWIVEKFDSLKSKSAEGTSPHPYVSENQGEKIIIKKSGENRFCYNIFCIFAVTNVRIKNYSHDREKVRKRQS